MANGLTNAKILLDKVRAGKEQFHVIEVMACPGGCIGGGGQPYPPEGVKVLDPELLRKRAAALYPIDSGKKLRKSYENPAIDEVYSTFLGGPGYGTGPPAAPHPLSRPSCREAFDELYPDTTTGSMFEPTAQAALGDEIAAYIEQCRVTPEPQSQLIAVLHQVQAQFGYLGRRPTRRRGPIAAGPAAKVAGVASFYHFFRLQPRGKFLINVCLGTACYVKGADRVAQKVMDELGITWGETSKDGIFTLEGSRCLGTCGLAPVIMIGEEVHPT